MWNGYAKYIINDFGLCYKSKKCYKAYNCWPNHICTSSSYGFSLFRGCHSESLFLILPYSLYLLLWHQLPTCPPSLHPYISSSGLPLHLLPGSSISSILLPMYPLSLLCTWPNHLNLASLAFSPSLPVGVVNNETLPSGVPNVETQKHRRFIHRERKFFGKVL